MNRFRRLQPMHQYQQLLAVRSGIFPFSDLDFRTAPFVIEALKKRLEHEVLGYTFACKEWSESIINWVKERHGWVIREEMLTFTPGIVRGLAFVIHCFTDVFFLLNHQFVQVIPVAIFSEQQLHHLLRVSSHYSDCKPSPLLPSSRATATTD